MAKYNLNENFFDVIDSSSKAYWLGFIWGDGYVLKRVRGTYTSCEFKLGLSEKDIDHLHKFNNELESSCPIHLYTIKSGFSTDYKEARLMVSRKYFASRLYDLGIQPHREKFVLVLESVPKEYHIDLLRGIIDADGGITQRNIQYKKGPLRTEYSIHLIANPDVLIFYNELLREHGIATTTYKQYKRHKQADGTLLSIRITGNRIVEKVVDFLYAGKESLSLKRKYQQYVGIKSYMDEYRKENVTYES